MSTVDIGQLPASYEEAVKELEQLVARMEAGELSLEQSIEAYKRGATLIQFCTTKLDKIEQQVRVLDKDIFKPFQPTDETEK